MKDLNLLPDLRDIEKAFTERNFTYTIEKKEPPYFGGPEATKMIGRTDGAKLVLKIEVDHTNKQLLGTNGASIAVVVWERTPKGGMQSKEYTSFYHNSLSQAIDKFLTWFKAYTPDPAKLLPKSSEVVKHKFVEGSAIRFQPRDDGGFAVSRTPSQIATIVHMEVIHLDGRKLDKDVYNPEHGNLWYHLMCTNHAGATFDILSDGEEFIPVNRYGKDRDGKLSITTTMQPKSSVDLSKMNELDKELINFAIEKFYESKSPKATVAG